VAVEDDGRVLFANTLFSCLARLSERHSFEPVWRPPFVSALAPEDRCHLNGLAMDGGRPRFVTAVAPTDVAGGWRQHRADGGVVVDVETGEVVATGLSMPHSPRLHRGELWALSSGRGEIGRVDLATGRFEPVAFCPGYLRGLAFVGDAALVGLSKPRDKTFHGLPLDARLAAEGEEARCGLRVVDLASGRVLHSLDVEGLVVELYDVAVVPGAVRPMALGFRSDELRRTLTFEEGGKTVRLGLRRLEDGQARPEAAPVPQQRRPPAPAGPVAPAAQAVGSGVPGSATGAAIGASAPVAPAVPPARLTVRCLDLTLAQALPYAALTYPDLRRTALGRPLREPLLAAVAAPPGGAPLAAAVAEIKAGGEAVEVLSLFVRPAARRRGLAGRLLATLEGEAARRGATRIELLFRSTQAGAPAVRRLLAARGWSAPVPRLRLGKADARVVEAAVMRPRRLPEGYEIFPWAELTADERREVVERQQRSPWFPPALSPFQMEDRVEPALSLGLRHRGRVAGWLICHRVGAELVQCTSLFVEEGHRRLGRGLALLAAAAESFATCDVERVIFMVEVANAPMMRFFERRLASHLAGSSEMLGSSLTLGG
jgi:ribosomal protein S18 acetylase RimI-like enzyme